MSCISCLHRHHISEPCQFCPCHEEDEMTVEAIETRLQRHKAFGTTRTTAFSSHEWKAWTEGKNKVDELNKAVKYLETFSNDIAFLLKEIKRKTCIDHGVLTECQCNET